MLVLSKVLALVLGVRCTMLGVFVCVVVWFWCLVFGVRCWCMCLLLVVLMLVVFVGAVGAGCCVFGFCCFVFCVRCLVSGVGGAGFWCYVLGVGGGVEGSVCGVGVGGV